MIKEEILENCLDYDDPAEGDLVIKESVIYKAMQKYADQETKEKDEQIKGMREALEELIDWDKKYPAEAIYSITQGRIQERELTAICNKAKAALNHPSSPE